jgi:hypothetical protein
MTLLANRPAQPYRPRLAGGCWLACVLSLATIGASYGAEIAVQVVTSWKSDSNPLRFPNDNTAEVNTGNSRTRDQVLATDVRAGLIVPLLSERTRLVASATQGDRRYDHYTQLSHRPHAIDVALEWAMGNALTGKVGAADEQRLYDYLNGSLIERDLIHQRRTFGDLALRITPNLDITAGLQASRLRYDLQVNQLYNREENAQQIGLRYNTGTGSNITAGARFAHAQFPERTASQIANLDSGYRETEYFLDSEWVYSVKTKGSLRVGMIERKYETLSTQNTQLVNLLGRTTYQYSPKTRLDLQIYERPFSIIDPNTLFITARGGRFDASWQATPKTTLGLFVTRENVLFKNSSNAAAGTPDNRAESVWRPGLRLDYAATRGVRFFVDGFRETRKRSPDLAGIEQTVVRMGLEYTYENIDGAAQRSGLNRYTQNP